MLNSSKVLSVLVHANLYKVTRPHLNVRPQVRPGYLVKGSMGYILYMGYARGMELGAWNTARHPPIGMRGSFMFL